MTAYGNKKKCVEKWPDFCYQLGQFVRQGVQQMTFFAIFFLNKKSFAHISVEYTSEMSMPRSIENHFLGKRLDVGKASPLSFSLALLQIEVQSSQWYVGLIARKTVGRVVNLTNLFDLSYTHTSWLCIMKTEGLP